MQQLENSQADIKEQRPLTKDTLLLLLKYSIMLNLYSKRQDLLHEDLRVIRNHVSVYHGPEGDVIACGLNVLIHQFSEALPPQTADHVGRLPGAAAHLLGQDLGVHERAVVHRPAGDGRAALGYGSLEQT